MTTDEKVHLIERLPDNIPLLESLEIIDLPASTWYYRQKNPDNINEESARVEFIKTELDEIVRENPGYGYRRIKPEYEERTGEVINHKRLLKLLNDVNLALLREVNKPGPNPVKQILDEHAGSLNLVKDFDPDIFEMLTTDFTEFRWSQGSRKAWLIVMLEQVSRLAVSWAVGSSRNRSLALEAWQQTKKTYEEFSEELFGTVVHHDQDSVFTSFAWPRAVILESGCVMSFSENGAKENPWIESFWGRMKSRCLSRLIEATTMRELKEVVDEEMSYYNCKRRHSSLGNISPMKYLESEGISIENITLNRG